MRTNFFQALKRLQSVGAWVINVDFSAGHGLIVSVLLKSQDGENQNSQLPPMVFKGTAQEIDEGILEGLTKPVEQTKMLFANISAYNKGLEEAKAKLVPKHKAEKQAVNTEKQKPAESISDKPKFEDIIKDINALNAACKYAEAVSMVPIVEDYPDKKSEIGKLKADLEWRMKQLTLL
ncbi:MULTISPECIES: PRTRC system protein E [Pedobacter]|uniref:PRTRC system protein E n=1 Tax=Pedobacter TaxID=84567 RepID=UPI0011F8F770|nr:MULTISPECIES: PRTRC system protein E [Pedobacter]RZJ87999.1 MAG: PRTRC system protein E [Chryseobacterium sp.]